MVRGSCLCGDVAWTAGGPLDLMAHCHCSRCRKAHGAAFSTYVRGPAEAFRIVRGADRILRWESQPGFARPSCRRCGSVVPDGVAYDGRVSFPAGPLDDDPGIRPVCQIFAASKATWIELDPAIPAYDEAAPA